jgi:hypothetical protein
MKIIARMNHRTRVRRVGLGEAVMAVSGIVLRPACVIGRAFSGGIATQRCWSPLLDDCAIIQAKLIAQSFWFTL